MVKPAPNLDISENELIKKSIVLVVNISELLAALTKLVNKVIDEYDKEKD